MTTTEMIDALASALAADAGLIPLQRRIRNRLTQIEDLVDLGMPLRTLAIELANRGAIDKSGNPLSEGHLRVLLSRARQKARSQRATGKRPAAGDHTPEQPPTLTNGMPASPSSAAPDFIRRELARREEEAERRAKRPQF